MFMQPATWELCRCHTRIQQRNIKRTCAMQLLNFLIVIVYMCLSAKLYFKSDKTTIKTYTPSFEFSNCSQRFTRTIHDDNVQGYETYADNCIKGQKRCSSSTKNHNFSVFLSTNWNLIVAACVVPCTPSLKMRRLLTRAVLLLRVFSQRELTIIRLMKRWSLFVQGASVNRAIL
jgi:hypothetical protein